MSGDIEREVVIGVDPHRRSFTVCVMDRDEAVLGSRRFASTTSGFDDLTGFVTSWPRRRWAVEGAHGNGRGLAQRLVCAGERVADVPAKLAYRVRVADTGHGRKTDAFDAAAVAVCGWRNAKLAAVVPDDAIVRLRLLTIRRRNLQGERTRTVNRLHRLLCDLIPGGVARGLSAGRARLVLRGVRPRDVPGRARREIASELVSDIEALDRKLAKATRKIEDAVAATETSLGEIYGVGPIVIAIILGEVVAVGRFPSRHHFATYNGTAPIEVSSGELVRHRLNRGGNRQLNHAIHIVALSQIRNDTDGRRYWERKRSEGKSKTEATRALKRRISDAVYRRLVADANT